MENNNQRPAAALDGRTAWITLGMLTFAYALAYVDRQMLSLLVDPIKTSLLINDTQFSLIQGSAFVLAYMASAPVFGRLVDVAKRRNILILGVGLWSIFTAMCGLATNFWELFLFRVGVGFAEGCIFPVAMSMIADVFSRERTPRAMSIFTLGVQIGGGFSLVAGGLVVAFAEDLTRLIPLFSELEKWQMALIVVGLPGLIFAASLFLLSEPARGRGGTETTANEKVSLKGSLAIFWKERAFYGRFYGMICCWATIQLGLPLWYPSILIRTQGMSIAEVGLSMGTISVIVGTAGTLVGPNISRWLVDRGYPDGAWRLAATCAGVLALTCFAVPFVSKTGALIIVGLIVFFSAVPLGPVISEMQNATHSRMRGMAGSLQTFAAQLVGYMIGPTVMALITDYVFSDPAMIGHSFQIVTCTAGIIAVWLFCTIYKPYYNLLSVGQGRIT